ncbi:MAG: HugZ family protein [Rhodospirillaceae bacterium]
MSLALDARRLFRAQQHATLGTLSTALSGYPYCSIVPYVVDYRACPIILASRLAEHTHNISADPRVCLFVHDGMSDVQAGSRATLMGNAHRIEGDDPATERYARYFPQAREYASNLDFAYYRIEPVSLRVVAGFAKAHWISREAYTPPAGDYATREAAVVGELNQRHAAAVREYCAHQLDFDATHSAIVGIDCDGFDLAADGRRLRVPFPAAAPETMTAAVFVEQALRVCTQ